MRMCCVPRMEFALTSSLHMDICNKRIRITKIMRYASVFTPNKLRTAFGEPKRLGTSPLMITV
jgi:hypothetical protein